MVALPALAPSAVTVKARAHVARAFIAWVDFALMKAQFR